MTKILALPGEGERLDRFELVAELASGGMATVYLARFVGMAGFKRFVAIKRLHPHLAKEHDFIQMFLDEARLAARLHHPNVVPILEIGVQQDQQYYVVMEYIEGDTAGHLLGRAAHVHRKVPVAVAVRIMLDALTGLHAAHELADEDGTPLDIVHRDVSPQNILVGVDGVARLTDFGVAKAATRLQNATQSGQLKGKLAYMSPEQVRGNLPVDRRADVFAAGIVLWEMLTGYRLFKAEGEAETLFKVIAAEVPSIRAYEPSVPPEVEVVVMRALAREPDQRFRTAADFAEALEQAARVYDLVATVRATAAFVNEMIGVDISQQREIVRAWLARSDVSRSGIARSAALAQAGIPDVAPPPRSAHQRVAPQVGAPQPELASLVDDDMEMATRVDDPEPDPDDATRIQPQVQAPAASGPVLNVSRSQDPAYMSYPTAREFQPMGAAASNNPALASTLSSPMSSPMAPGPGGSAPWPQAGASGPWQQQPGASGPWQQQPGASGPWPPQAAPAAAPARKTLPAWTMLIPAVIIIGGAVLLALHARNVQAPAPKAPVPSATPAVTQPSQNHVEPQPSPAPSAVAPLAASAAVTVSAAPPPTSAPSASAPTAAETVTHAPPPPPPATHVHHSAGSSTTVKKSTTIENKEFGGRE